MDEMRERYRQEHQHEAVNKPQPAPQHHESPAPAAPGRPKKHKKMRAKKLVLAIIAVIILIGIAAGGWLFAHRNTSPIPEHVRKAVSFAIYYPSGLPTGYKLDKSSIKNSQGVVYYSISDANNKVSFSEQAAPAQPPDLSTIQKFNTSFKNVNTPAGQAILGVDVESKLPTAIIVSNTTLISLSASKSVPLDVMTSLVQNMTSLP